MLLKVKASNGTVTDVEFASTSETTVGELKAEIASKTTIPVNQQRLIYKGKILKDEGTLESYNILNGESIHLVKGATPSSTPSAPAPAASTSAPAAAPQASALPVATPVDPFGGMEAIFGMGGMGGMGQNPFAGLGGMGNQNLQQMQQQMMQDPAMMSQIMNR